MNLPWLPAVSAAEMEIIDLCSGKRWRLRVIARGEEAMRWLRDFEAAELPAPQRCEEGEAACGPSWRFQEAACIATSADPLFEVEVALGADAARVQGRLGGKVVTLECHALAEHAPAPCVRPATPQETLEVGMRWLLGVGHVGCTHPDEMCFWARAAQATAFVVDDVAAWLRAGTPLPTPLARRRGQGLFMGVLLGEGTSLRAWRELDDSLLARHPLHAGYSGAYCDMRLPKTRGRALLALASLR